MLNQVSESLLAPSGLELSHLSKVLNHFANRQIDYADLYFQLSQDESWSLEDSIIKEGGFYIDRGFGVRAVSGEKTGFAYADQIGLSQLEQCATAARSITNASGQLSVKSFKQTNAIKRYASVNPLDTLSREQKVELLHLVDKVARAEDPRVIQVNAGLSAVYEEMLVAATDGTLAADIRPLVRLSVSVLVEENSKRERGSAGAGGRFGLNWFFEPQVVNGEMTGDTRAVYLAKEAVRMALVNLSAMPAPAGTMPIVLGAGWPGILLHEAVGHGLEGDFNRKESSLFTGKIGELVTSPLCTIVDDGTVPNVRGSITVDDEGVPSQRNVLIENGILKGYMQDKLNARLMGVAPTGNGRRESYAHLPMPRMTNTYLTEGSHSFEEMIESVDYGIYAPHFSGGQVDITSGKFVFSTAEAYLIEKGKITKPVIGATLIGSGIDAMQQVSMVGKKMELDPGIGTCGKEGQSVPVGVGQPTVKLDKITVGGRG
ncbi:protease TldD [Actinobacillus pleuropneumoniae]|uniref:TldD-like protein n=1 Tax=Actinobacillus pleuropneumoniae serotype 5b (strain L20) TaxID=416269 RepID=A3N2I8_ACTP2|nr:metalloprotease TldD [Actinobacillus pleuropneumoniae]ABN74624.1 TldD-like protein [Actinobacillus pleuropneumoniae serovar 5b str. L20]MEE3684033.1 metalloprotease TldD [Actinobacillus pleuropneumoniae]QSZ39598.1 protease TldD [Actinobacillus pleuropneumoniae]UKH09883.1 metalloprotease TldD [Actinobacillus pleuropneumoniae]UPK77782.1 metalloprotease TldD [Actinobacillus pleuropneumoniae]